MAKDKITRAQIQEIRTLTRRANRRIERATGGQRRTLEYYARTNGKPGKFSAATKGMTAQQAQAQIEKLNRFLGAMSTTKIGWEWIKKEIVHKSAKTLGGMGYDLTDEELSDILMQLDDASNEEFYRAVNLVQAEKVEAMQKVEDLEAQLKQATNAKERAEIREKIKGAKWGGTVDEIVAAINQKASAQEALEKSIKAREYLKGRK